MTDTAGSTALVTGANSGLGLEAAAQLAEQGYDRVIITARTNQKAEAAPTVASHGRRRDSHHQFRPGIF